MCNLRGISWLQTFHLYIYSYTLNLIVVSQLVTDTTYFVAKSALISLFDYSFAIPVDADGQHFYTLKSHVGIMAS